MPNRPPKEWWDKHYQEVKKGNPSYSDEQIRGTVGKIWHENMSKGQKEKETKKSEGSLRVSAQDDSFFKEILEKEMAESARGWGTIPMEQLQAKYPAAQSVFQQLLDQYAGEGLLNYSEEKGTYSMTDKGKQYVADKGVKMDPGDRFNEHDRFPDQTKWRGSLRVAAKNEPIEKLAGASDVIDGMAEALWATMWADKMDELGVGGHMSGMEITEIMPKVPPEAIALGQKIAQQIEQANSISLDNFIPPGFSSEDWYSSDAEKLGWYLAMQSMGHGVSWADDHEDHGLKLPHVENYELDDLAYQAVKAEYGSEVQEEELEGERVSDHEGSTKRVEATKMRVHAQFDPPTGGDDPFAGELDIDSLVSDLEGKAQVLQDGAAKLQQVKEQGQGQEAVNAVLEELNALLGGGTPKVGRIRVGQAKSVNFPNLFSSEAKRWILTETKRRSADRARTSGSPEQTVAYIDQSAKEVAEYLAQAVASEITAILDEQTKQKIYDEISIQEEPMAAPGAPQVPAGPTDAPAPTPAPAPMVGSTRVVAPVHMPFALRVAFGNKE